MAAVSARAEQCTQRGKIGPVMGWWLLVAGGWRAHSASRGGCGLWRCDL